MVLLLILLNLLFDYKIIVNGISNQLRQRRSSIPCGISFTPCSRVVFPFGLTSNTSYDNEIQARRITSLLRNHTNIIRLISGQNITAIVRDAKNEIDMFLNGTEIRIFRSINAFDGLSAERTWNAINKINLYSKKLSYSSQISILATEKLYNSIPTLKQIPYELSVIDVDNAALSSICHTNLITRCPLIKYRTYAGHCNNVNHPLWGVSSRSMQRLLKPIYADKISKPRISNNGSSLPSARKISHNLITEPINRHASYSMMIAQWAMFIYEDIIHTGVTTLYEGNQSKPLLCCNQQYIHPECYPIEADENDMIYSTLTRCLPYVRTATSPRENCSLGPREQVNQATSYLDASHIYGSTVERANKLRAYQNGLLLSQQNSQYNITLLPNTIDDTCWNNRNSRGCFLTDGKFTNLFPTQTALHTIWLRQHNNIAKQLKAINIGWDDEKLFQESRRIIIAQIQHITYNEFLPIIVGMNKLRQYDIRLRLNGYDSDYNLRIDATALNEYASAVGLFYYSLFSDHVFLYENNEENHGTKKSWNAFIKDPELFYGDKIDTILRFLLRETIHKPGLHMNKYFKNEFLRGEGNYGLDLAAMIIQMGRDHGIPGYTAFRSECGLQRLTNFSDLADIVLKSLDLDELAKLYNHIDDVDLFVLGMAEKPEIGALVGPTFTCIFGRQFQKIRRGDRFWYENFFVPTAFTLEQLEEIRKTTLARIICDNSNVIQQIQPNVFILADIYRNSPVYCNSTIIDTIDLTKWTDQEPRLKLPITMATLEKAIRLGAEHAKYLNEAEANRIKAQKGNGNMSSQQSSAVCEHSILMAPKNVSLEISRRAEVLRETTKILLRGDGLSEEERLPLQLDLPTLQRLLPEIDVSQFVGNITNFLGEENPSIEECLSQPLPCDHTTKYRTFSGWCNNLKFPHYGNAFAPMRRLLDPVYEDGFDSPRILGDNRRNLPSARKVSNAVHAETPVFHTVYTHMLMQMGQIIDHDFAHSPVSRGPGNTILDCSRCDSAETVSIHCFPIPIENGDPYFPHLHDNGEPRCISFVRSLLGQLTLGYRNQLNQLTSYIDASFIYGSTKCEANKLRLFSQGRLAYTNLGFNREALPQGHQERDCRSNPQYPCFNAGDERSNEQPGLTVLHTLFLREHNRIAISLSNINSHWFDEKIYLETRRIMGAKVQHIVYNEWLPIVLGSEAAAKYDLVPRKFGYYHGYDDKCDATMTHEMATAAFRFGHSLIRNIFPRMNAKYQEKTDGLDLKTSFNNVTFYYTLENGHIESIIMGLLGSLSMGFDRHISDAIRNHLFQRSTDSYTGMDLPAINIQRGRDHGIPPYNSYREICGMHRARNFDDLRDIMDEKTIAALRSVYNHVDDIDLFPGIMSENPLKGALVGPMIICIIGEQFQRLKRCDRFYYENDNPATKFTPDQLAEIRKTTLSKLICANSQYARNIQPNAFLLPNDLTNAPVKCSELPEIDIYKWLDQQFCTVDNRVIQMGRTERIKPCIMCTCTAEGAECHAMVIDHCESLLNHYLLSEVIDDTACVIQCSSLIRQKNGQL